MSLFRAQSVLIAALLVAAGFGLFRVVVSGTHLIVTERSQTNYLIASWNDPREDAELISRVSGARRVRYARSDDPFVRGIVRGVKLDIAEAERRGIVVFSGESCTIDKLATETDPLGAALGLADAEAGRRQGSKLPMAFVLGAVAGLWTRLRRRGLAAAMALGVGLSLYQYATACPTCPTTSLMGVPVSLWGASLYGLLATGLALPRTAVWVQQWIGSVAAAVLAWQLGAATVGGTDCLPCALVASLNALIAVSAAMGGVPRAATTPRPRMGRTLVAVASCALAAFAVARVAGTDATGGAGSTPAPPSTLVGLNISTLGLKSALRPEMLLLGSEKCAPCHDAMVYFLGRPELPVRLAYSGNIPPEVGSRGESIPRPELLSATPTAVITDAEGVVVWERKGWSDGAGADLETRIRALEPASGRVSAR